MGDEKKPTRWADIKEKAKYFWDYKAKPFAKTYSPYIIIGIGSVVLAITAYFDQEHTSESDPENDTGSDSQNLFTSLNVIKEETRMNNCETCKETIEAISPTKEKPICRRCGCLMEIPAGRYLYKCNNCDIYGSYNNEGHFIWNVDPDPFGKKSRTDKMSDFELADFCHGGDLTEE